MLDGFPELWFDELLYHGLARYQDRIRLPVWGDFMLLLFGKANMVPTVAFPSALSHLADSIPSIYGYTGDYLIQHHTLAPLYKLSLSQLRYNALCNTMLSRTSQHPHMLLGINASSYKLSKWIKYCPYCIQEDKKQYGEPYFHRSHQIPYIIMCWKHAAFLKESNVLTYSRSEFVAAKRATFDLSADNIDQRNPEHAILWQMAKDSFWLLNINMPDLTHDSLIQKYNTILAEKNFFTPNGTLRTKELVALLRDACPQSVLKMLDIDLNTQSTPRWLILFHLNGSKTIPPIRHLLLIQSLGYTIKQLFKIEALSSKLTDENQFGDGPWPCLNKASNHYCQLVITQCTYKIKLSGQLRKIIGRFACPMCGFIYHRTSSNTTFEYCHVAEYGPVWENELRRLWLDTNLRYTLQDMANRLNVMKETAKRQALRLGLPFPPPGRYGKSQYIAAPEPSAKHNYKAEHQATYLNAREKYPDAKIIYLQKMIGTANSWLQRNDQQWYNDHKPVSNRKVPKKNASDDET